jgi:hypothetical protein
MKAVKTARSTKTIKPSFQKLGPEFKENAKAVAEALAAADADQVAKSVETEGNYPVRIGTGVFNVRREHFTIVERPASEDSMQFRYGNVSIDTNITEKLKEELMVREVTRHIQMLRKKLGLTRMDKIRTRIAGDEPTRKLLAANEDQIKGVTRSSKIDLVDKAEMADAGDSASEDLEVFDKTIRIVVSHRSKKE